MAGPVQLRAAAVWGTNVLTMRALDVGESFLIGDRAGAVLPKPDLCPVADAPIRAVGLGWELDPRGATGGLLYLRGRRENPFELSQSGEPIPIVAGDYGIVQYGNFGVFFQFTLPAPALSTRRRIDWGLLLAFLLACVSALGGLALLWAITTPPAVDKPIELVSQQELLARFKLKYDELLAMPTISAQQISAQQQDNKGRKNFGSGKRFERQKGAPGAHGTANEIEPSGDVESGSGMPEALSTDDGVELKETLGRVGSVGDALGGQVAGKDAPKPSRALNRTQVARVITSRMGAFRACYEAAATREPTLAGGMTVNFTVSPAGSVGSASVSGSSLHDARVEACVLRQFQRLQFPAAEKPTGGSFPFVFKPSNK